MRNHPLRLFAVALLLLAFAAVLVGPVPCTAADEKKLEVGAGDTMGDLLAKLVGSPVELTLRNGATLSGKLSAVHKHLLVLSALRGKEFYDAIIRVEDVSAATVRMRDR